MQLSSRRFLIAQDGVLYRLADATFARMLQNPRKYAFAILAGQRVCMASLIVELIGGKPARVVRSTFATLTFDEDGHMDLGMFTRQQWALAESALDPLLVRTKPEEKVLDAAARFIAQGGRWRPSNACARAINEAAVMDLSYSFERLLPPQGVDFEDFVKQWKAHEGRSRIRLPCRRSLGMLQLSSL
jgi:hypothetical protein